MVQMRSVPCLEKLAQTDYANWKGGEDLLRENAERAGERTMWKTHLNSLAVNLAGGAAIWAFGDGKDALISVASGIAFSELAIYTQPGREITDLEDYENEFSGFQSQKKIQLACVSYQNRALGSA